MRTYTQKIFEVWYCWVPSSAKILKDGYRWVSVTQKILVVGYRLVPNKFLKIGTEGYHVPTRKKFDHRWVRPLKT